MKHESINGLVMSKKIVGIYKITSPIGRLYIGQSRDILNRFKKYKLLTGGLRSQIRLFRSLVKYGHESHAFEIIHECEIESLNELEMFYIELFDTFDTEHGLNLTSGGCHFKISQETRDKISAANRNRGPESWAKMALSKIGNTYRRGKKISQEAKDKVSAANKGRKVSREHAEKISKANLGKKHTEESKIKMRKKRGPEFALKIKNSWIIRKQIKNGQSTNDK